MAMKLQHWLLTVEYLPGQENWFADALLWEERPRYLEIVAETGSSLASVDVGKQPH